MSRILASFIVLYVLLGGVSSSFAQESIPEDKIFRIEEPVKRDKSSLDEIRQCSEYYRPNSVQVYLLPNIEQTVPGATVLLQGVIKNTNTYPVTDGTLRARVERQTGSTSEIVDEFLINDTLILKAGEELPISHPWVVPTNAEGGEYHISYTFVSAGQFVLFDTANISKQASSTAPSSVLVTSENAVVKFGDVNVSVDGQSAAVDSLESIPFAYNSEVIVTTTVTNPAAQKKAIPLQWNQYAWDTYSEKNLRNTETELITLEPNETKTLSYTVENQAEAGVSVTAYLQDIDVKSLIEVKLARQDSNNIRVMLATLSEYPVVAGTERTIFACVKSANDYTIENAAVKLDLSTVDGTSLQSYTFVGNIGPGYTGFGKAFTVDGDYNNLILTASLDSDGHVFETVSVTYNCNPLDAQGCDGDEIIDDSFMNFLTSKYVLAAGGVILLLSFFLVWSVWRRRQKKKEPTNIIDGVEMTMPSE